MSHAAAFAGTQHDAALRHHPSKHVLLGGRPAFARHARGDRPLPAWQPRELADSPAAPLVQARQVRAEDIRFRRLTTSEAIATVLPLRREINLPLAGDAGFAALEKKETRAASSVPSTGRARRSAPSASCRWGRASRPASRSWRASASRPSCSRTAGK
jgi:hypothetical protein